MVEVGTEISDKTLREPVQRQIFEGAEIDVINREGIIQGRAKLLQRCPSKWGTDNLPYVKHELDDSANIKRDKYSHMWSYERWMVEWITHSYYRPGHRTCTEVNYYIHTRINHESHLKGEMYGVTFSVKTSPNKFIFVEEEGTLITPISNYPKPAVKALNKIYKIYGGEIIMYSYNNPSDTRTRFQKNGGVPRILSFLNTDSSFENSIAQYVEDADSKDFMILAGVSKINHSRVIHIDMNKGIGLKKDSAKRQRSA